MDESTLKQLMRQNCTAVFATMLEATILEISADQPTSLETEERVVSLIGFGGDHNGNCMITCSKRLACNLASAMLMEQYPEVTEEVMDALGEISNMIFGNVKTDLEEDLGPLRLTIPTVIVGKSFNVRNVSNQPWVAVKFSVLEEEVDVRMCITAPQASPLARAELIGRALA
jgi:CheY-specific phosphatase CheX